MTSAGRAVSVMREKAGEILQCLQGEFSDQGLAAARRTQPLLQSLCELMSARPDPAALRTWSDYIVFLYPAALRTWSDYIVFLCPALGTGKQYNLHGVHMSNECHDLRHTSPVHLDCCRPELLRHFAVLSRVFQQDSGDELSLSLWFESR
eukprot:SAG31_NODE_2206_length_6194_cov_3.730763_4_plen_150_part_00